MEKNPWWSRNLDFIGYHTIKVWVVFCTDLIHFDMILILRIPIWDVCWNSFLKFVLNFCKCVGSTYTCVCVGSLFSKSSKVYMIYKLYLITLVIFINKWKYRSIFSFQWTSVAHWANIDIKIYGIFLVDLMIYEKIAGSTQKIDSGYTLARMI